MNKKIELVLEPTPVNVSHDTYRRECQYNRGIHIEEYDFHAILDAMCYDSRLYFDFHNPRKEIKQGTYLNGHSGLARDIYDYYKTTSNIELTELINGRDFYVKII